MIESIARSLGLGHRHHCAMFTLCENKSNGSRILPGMKLISIESMSLPIHKMLSD